MKHDRFVTQVERDYSADERLISETNMKGFVTSANASFCEVSGFTLEELIGQRHNIVRHPDVPKEVFSDLWRTIKAGERWIGVIKNRCKNGDHYWVKAYVSPIVRDGEIIGYRSVRVKPSREEIADAEQMFKAFRSGNTPVLDTLKTMYGYTGKMKLSLTTGQQLALTAAWPSVWMVLTVIAATMGASPIALWTMLALAVGTSGALAWLVFKQQERPIQQLHELTAALERGDLGARVQLPGCSKTALAYRELNQALDGIDVLVSEMAQVFSGMARGDLERRVQVS